ncbi:hypothetical protein [Saccharothrix variisporea]|uniref:Secreted protein n=1 Tax=Saccharothrix variisporea TaxID=543527 RepID=A0A495XAJ8_9PSEU|nr:hypothetical protein [Saccharothrix variisporea]RKT70386.1 hypothetical protein DFJ66_3646 [Saccharothrix variisporea]
MKSRLVAVAAALLFLSVGTAGTASATTDARFDVAEGTMTFCLTPEVQNTFDEAGLKLVAIEPAAQADTLGHQCVVLPVTGRADLDMAESDLRFEGGFAIQGPDERELSFGEFRAETDEGALVSYAKAQGRDDEIEFFARPLGNSTVEPSTDPFALRTAGPIAGTESVHQEFEYAFGSAVVEPGTEWLQSVLGLQLAAV